MRKPWLHWLGLQFLRQEMNWRAVLQRPSAGLGVCEATDPSSSTTHRLTERHGISMNIWGSDEGELSKGWLGLRMSAHICTLRDTHTCTPAHKHRVFHFLDVHICVCMYVYIYMYIYIYIYGSAAK